MKKIILTLSFILASYILKAQVLYGTTYLGGKNNGGAICKLVTSANTLSAAFSFDAPDGKTPQSSLLQASDGKLYGMTSDGGENSKGVIFLYDPATSTYTTLENFDGLDGASPSGNLIQASNGKLYGMTTYGGSSDNGVIFSYDPAASAYTKLKEFNGPNGTNPYSTLIQASDGKLYGMTNNGGENGKGVIFSYDPVSATYKKLIDFDGLDGASPYGSLIQASNGNLYGMTSGGGENDAGVIFSYDPVTTSYTKLKDFDGINGTYPNGDLLQASDGKLYGMTVYGGSSNNGVIFSYDPVSATCTKLKDFDGLNGASPFGNVIQASDRKLYGMTNRGGENDAGVIFSYDPVTSSYTKLKDFDSRNGASPDGSLIQASDSNLYGMTYAGGTINCGVIFLYNTLASTYTKLRNFGANNTGNYLSGALIKGQANKLYGMAYEGGIYGAGTIFSFDANTSVFTKLNDFDGINGLNPYGSLMQASDGKLYGMTGVGGSNDIGVIFSYDPATSVYTKLKDFSGADGSYPFGSLVQASDGKLYGMTSGGGSVAGGVIFSYDPATSKYTKLKDLDATKGYNPFGSLILASDGKLYGMTYQGGSSSGGVIFSYDPVTSAYTKLVNFDGTNGGSPYGSLIQASDGKLYGMTSRGGDGDYGVMFSYEFSTSTYTKLKDFDYYTNGAYPFGSVIQASDGNLYGMTSGGGSNNSGVAFSYDISTSTYTKLRDFNGDNGSGPGNTSFIEIPCTITTYYHDADKDGFGDINESLKLCETLDGYVTDSSDCNDSDAFIHPGATEICNGVDDNCNGVIDEDCTAGEVQIAIADKSVIEGNEGREFIFVPVILSEKSEKIIRFNYTTHNNTAIAGNDYIAQSGTLVFPPSIKKIIVPIRIIGDETTEANETFNIILSDPVNATIADGTGIVTILNDDASTFNAAQGVVKTTPTISLSPNPSNDILKITLTGYSGNPVIQLCSIDGRILHQQKLHILSAKSVQQQMNVASYSNGTYLVTVVDEKGNRQTEKLVIDR